MKLAVYTCITGGYDTPPAIWQKDEGVDYICFTDDPEMQSQDWTMMPIPHGLTTSGKAKTAKLAKASPHLLLKDYDVSVWVDGDVEIRGSVKQFLQKYNLAQFSFWACPHGARRDLFDEVFYAARYKKDSQQTLYRQSNRYRNEGMPDKYGLCDTSVLVRVHSRTACQQICQCWQREILAGSVIDRISLPYSIWRVKGSVGFLSENLTSGTGTFYRKDCHERYVKPVPGLLAVKTLNKTVVYTCITGGYDALRPISQPDPNLDYVCFTDNPATHAAGWTIHPVPEDLAEFSKVKQQRLVKIRPDKYLAEYDVSLWLDANLVVSCDLQKDFISKLDLDHCPLWTKKHPQRACVYDEAKSVVKLKKDTQENVGKQVESYRRLGYPARNGLAETNIMLRRHKDPLVVKAMEIWSKELSEKSHRDQLSFDFACWKAGLKYGKFEKKDVEKLIRLERHYRKEYVVRNASPDQQVTVAMATQPYRKAQMLRAVNQLLPQCDKLCICLNGYNSVPAELPKSDKIITVLANDSNGIPDLGCDNKMYWLGDYPGYYATVDDDISYPPNYIETLRRKVDEYNRQAICSFHGHLYSVDHGKINMTKEKLYLFWRSRAKDEYCNRVGMGVAMCYPSAIGLTKDEYMHYPKNTGDDEITAIWAQRHEIPLVCIGGIDGLINDRSVSVHGLCTQPDSVKRRRAMMESYVNWKHYTMDNKVFFRIIIPTYNVEELLPRCLDSVFNQSFKNFKLIVVDDKSTDKTRDAIEKYRSVHGFISVYPAEKLYAGGCRNAGLDEDCNSEYTIFLDSDDYFTDGSALQDMHDCAVANGMPDCINVGFNRYAGSKKIYQFDLAASPKDLLAKRCIAPWRKCVRSRFVKRFIPYRRKYNDVVQHFRTCDAIKTVVSLDKPIVTYCNDNKLSAWHLFKSSETDASLFYVIGDLMQEKFQTKACQEYQADYIRKYKAQLK